jgi:hypothetical protein
MYKILIFNINKQESNMEIYNEQDFPMENQPEFPIDNEQEYYEEDDYYDDDDETMSKGSWECSSIGGNQDEEDDDDFYIKNASIKTRSTFAQDIVHIESILKSKSYLDNKPDIELIVEEVLVTSIAPWKDYDIVDEHQIDFNDIVKETEEEKLMEAAAVQKAAEAAALLLEETYNNNRRHNNHKRGGGDQSQRKPFVKAPQVQLQPGETDKTRLCKFGKRCVTQKKCDRVHTFDDWEPNTCHYDKKCKILHKCRFIHTRETKADYLKRIIQQEDNRFYFGNQQLYLKNFGIQLNDNDKK